MNKMLSVFALFFLLTSQAEAGFLVEPYLGYQAIVNDMTLGAGAGPQSGQSVKASASGAGYGARLGYDFLNFFAAADIQMASLSSTVEEQPTGMNFDGGSSSQTALGLTVGGNFMFLRPYLGYVFDNQVKGDSSTGYGSGFKLGVGFSLIPKLKLNLEYQMGSFTKEEASGVTTTYSDSGFIKSMSYSGFGLNLSVPLGF